MNKRKDEKLIGIAFDDLRDESLSASEHRAVDSYRSLKKDLECLRDIPDHQLSNERLRTAILGQGLKPGKESSRGSDGSWFIVLGASAAMIAMFVVGSRLHRASTAPVIQGDSVSQPMASNDDFNLDFPKMSETGNGMDSWSHPIVFSGDKPKAHRHLTTAHRAIRHRSSQEDANGFDQNLFASSNPTVSDSEFTDNEEHTASRSQENSKGSAQHPKLDKVSSSPESKDIVEIDLDKDQNTGARSAREVESKNVAFGG